MSRKKNKKIVVFAKMLPFKYALFLTLRPDTVTVRAVADQPQRGLNFFLGGVDEGGVKREVEEAAKACGGGDVVAGAADIDIVDDADWTGEEPESPKAVWGVAGGREVGGGGAGTAVSSTVIAGLRDPPWRTMRVEHVCSSSSTGSERGWLVRGLMHPGSHLQSL